MCFVSCCHGSSLDPALSPRLVSPYSPLLPFQSVLCPGLTWYDSGSFLWTLSGQHLTTFPVALPAPLPIPCPRRAPAHICGLVPSSCLPGTFFVQIPVWLAPPLHSSVNPTTRSNTAPSHPPVWTRLCICPQLLNSFDVITYIMYFSHTRLHATCE